MLIEELLTLNEESGLTDKQKDLHKRWKKLINMSASSVENFKNRQLELAKGNDKAYPGLKPKKAKSLGISSGVQSANWIIKMKKTPVKEWTPEMWKWAGKQVSFVSRMTGARGPLRDEDGNPTRKLLSLKIWGNNPLREEQDEHWESCSDIVNAPEKITEGIVETPDTTGIKYAVEDVLEKDSERLEDYKISTEELVSHLNSALVRFKIYFEKSSSPYFDGTNETHSSGLDGASAVPRSGVIYVDYFSFLVKRLDSKLKRHKFVKSLLSLINHELVHREQHKIPSFIKNQSKMNYATPDHEALHDGDYDKYIQSFKKYSSQGIELVAFARQVAGELLQSNSKKQILEKLKTAAGQKSLSNYSPTFREYERLFSIKDREFRKFLTYIYQYVIAHEEEKQ